MVLLSSSDYLRYDCSQDEEICEKDLLNTDEVLALLQHEFERYALVCDSIFPLLMHASLKDDVRYDLYPYVSSPTYQHCYSLEHFHHKHEDWFEEKKLVEMYLLLS